MIKIAFLFFFLAMFLRDDAQVSKKKVFTIQWKIGAMLPDLQVGVH